ncbi:uncharacterized protein A4U43_C05F17270 [Asparagus officinalis]|uniref:malate dehydrogenase n=1 Tax=Asparagus officinalis TaxID=4686 RepID=A0A5P1ESH0_ASPOF|nr:uncharacterized protein A4U43_C05F17270 [Asparagus officinalis]
MMELEIELKKASNALKTSDLNKALSPNWNMCKCNTNADVALQADNSKLAYYALEFLYRWFLNLGPANSLSEEDIKALTRRTQDGGTEVVEAKAGKGSATLSMAYAGALFADACLKGLNGVPDVVECSFVQSSTTELPFFSSKVRLGKNGVEEVLGLGSLSDFEKQGLENLKAELKSSIEKGIKFANEN